MNNDDRIQLQLKLIDELQQTIDGSLANMSACNAKDAMIALQAAIDGLVALKKLAQSEAELTARDSAYAEFQAKRQRGK